MANVRQRAEKKASEDWLVLGIMSGTSLDGIDLCLCRFAQIDNRWSYSIVDATTYPYEEEWKERLVYRDNLPAQELLTLDHELGLLYGKMVQDFASQSGFSLADVDLISSHGHTLYHRPSEGISLQLGNGPEITAVTGLSCVCDFRKQDVALGGQGAPLVPVGDKMLFADHAACLNLGGFANISFDLNTERKAFDISPANFILNPIAQKLGFPYDANGDIARGANVHQELLDQLNALPFYQQDFPKSLSAEWVWEEFNPLLWQHSLSSEDLLGTLVEHIAMQIAAILNGQKLSDCLLTGGGTLNGYLLERLKAHSRTKLVIPGKEVIEFKEALVFAFLGLLKILGENNIWSSVTGASKDHSSGIVYQL